MSDVETPEQPSPAPRVPRLVHARHGVTRFFLETLRSAILALVVFLLVRTTLLEAFTIPTGSMEGTLLIGDFLLVNKAIFGAEIPGLGVSFPAIAEPARGDVIVFHPPHEPRKHYVKRVVGVGGDTLAMRYKRLYRNGIPVVEPYTRRADDRPDAVHPGMAWQVPYISGNTRPGRYRPSRDNWGPLVIPEGKFFVLGDNRDNSEDSRYWGFVERSSVRGRPWFVYYSQQNVERGELPFVRSIRWERIGERVQ